MSNPFAKLAALRSSLPAGIAADPEPSVRRTADLPPHVAADLKAALGVAMSRRCRTGGAYGLSFKEKEILKTHAPLTWAAIPEVAVRCLGNVRDFAGQEPLVPTDAACAAWIREANDFAATLAAVEALPNKSLLDRSGWLDAANDFCADVERRAARVAVNEARRQRELDACARDIEWNDRVAGGI